MKPKAIGLLAIFVFLMTLSACDVPSGGSEGGTTGETSPQFDPAFTVCNPFTDEATAANRGIVAQLKYLTPDQPRYTRAVDYIEYGTPVETTIFFNRLFVPTRPWDRGFITEQGQEILTANGDTLYEYFGLELRSHLKLGPADPEGIYQFAILSDDGALMTQETESGPMTIVDNDGTHPTRLGCSTEPVYLASGTRIPINIKYYQGPRYHISLIVLMRPWPDNPSDPLCGQQGNSLFFDSTQNPPQAKTPYYELLSRGWKVLENENYGLLPDIVENPCTPEEETLMISGVAVSNLGLTSVDIGWLTNVNADSKVTIRNVGTGAITTYTDLNLVKNHLMSITGLTSNTLYSFTVTSRTAGGQEVTNGEFAFKTKR